MKAPGRRVMVIVLKVFFVLVGLLMVVRLVALQREKDQKRMIEELRSAGLPVTAADVFASFSEVLQEPVRFKQLCNSTLGIC